MDAMLHALGGILLRAVPTFLLVILLHFYLKIVFFKPLEKVLNQRDQSTAGARKLAEGSLQQAAAKTTLAVDSDALANQIAESILRRNAA